MPPEHKHLPILGSGSGSAIAADQLQISLPVLESLPYPVMWIAKDYRVRWLNACAKTHYDASQTHCHTMSHGYATPCNEQGEACPKLRATEQNRPVSVNHVHQTQGGLELFKVTAIPINDGGVLELHVPLDDVMSRDKLTGLYAREFFERLVQRQLALLERMNESFSMIMIDLDHFKRVNDTYGHDVGDEVLAAVGAALRSTVRAADTAGRWGGEELCIFLPATEPEGAMTQAERVARAIGELEFSQAELHVTASLGVCTSKSVYDLKAGIQQADAAMYQAKRDGRDCIRYCTLPAVHP